MLVYQRVVILKEKREDIITFNPHAAIVWDIPISHVWINVDHGSSLGALEMMGIGWNWIGVTG